MKAVAWHGKRDVRVENVPDPGIREPDDVIVRIGAEVTAVSPGDRVVLPFNISCAHEQFQKKEDGCFKVVLQP